MSDPEQPEWLNRLMEEMETRPKLSCVKFGCENVPLIYLRIGDTKQTNNGFLIAKVPGWYCPNCAGSYGGSQ